MPSYKLSYFNMRGRGELIRICFAYGGIPYEDDRIERTSAQKKSGICENSGGVPYGDDRIEGTWAKRKSEMPSGQVPVLWIDGQGLTESVAIARYVAKQAGLVPQDDIQAAYCDALVDTLNGWIPDLYMKYRFSKAEPAERERILKEDIIPKFKQVLHRLNERLSHQETFISEMTTWADLHIVLATDEVKKNYPDFLKDYPAVSAHVERIKALTPIKNYFSNRPITDN